MLGWMKHKLKSRFLGEISINSDMKMTPHLWQKAKNNIRKILRYEEEVAGIHRTIQKRPS